MAWTYTGNAVILDSIHGNIDDGEKATIIPSSITAGEAPWIPDFLQHMRNEYALWLKRHSVAGTTTLQITGNNGAGDANGVGTITITLVTA